MTWSDMWENGCFVRKIFWKLLVSELVLTHLPKETELIRFVESGVPEKNISRIHAHYIANL